MPRSAAFTPAERSFHAPHHTCLPLLRGKIAFPDSNDSPTTLAQCARYEAIARNIPLKFRQPEFNPTFRGVAELATCVPMPEADAK